MIIQALVLEKIANEPQVWEDIQQELRRPLVTTHMCRLSRPRGPPNGSVRSWKFHVATEESAPCSWGRITHKSKYDRALAPHFGSVGYSPLSGVLNKLYLGASLHRLRIVEWYPPAFPNRSQFES